MKTRLEKLSAGISGEADGATKQEIVNDLKLPGSETTAVLKSLVTSAGNRLTLETAADQLSQKPVPSPKPLPRGSVRLLVAASVLLALGLGSGVGWFVGSRMVVPGGKLRQAEVLVAKVESK